MKKTAKIYYIIFITSFLTTSSEADILFKNRENIAKDIFKTDCFNKKQKSIKIKYLCALKGIGDGEINPSFSTIETLASQDISDAKYTLYATKDITGLDEKKAIFYLEEAAKDGLPIAQLRMAEIYQLGEENVHQDYKLAFFG